MATCAVVIGTVIVNLIVCDPGDRISGAEVVDTQKMPGITLHHRYEPGRGFIAPDRYAVVYGRRVEAIIQQREGEAPPKLPDGATAVVKIEPHDAVSQFRTSWDSTLGFRTEGPDSAGPSR